MVSNRKKGSKYEAIAARYLSEQGYQIIAKNYRTRNGELDIVAKEGDVYVFVEVKYRSTSFKGSSLEAVDYKKQVQISKMAANYLTRYKLGFDRDIRFDVIGIDGKDEIKHIKNAFLYCWRN